MITHQAKRGGANDHGVWCGVCQGYYLTVNDHTPANTAVVSHSPDLAHEAERPPVTP